MPRDSSQYARHSARIRVSDIRSAFVEQKDTWKRLTDVGLMLSFIVGLIYVAHVVVIVLILDDATTSLHNAALLFAPFMLASGLKLYNSFVASWSIQVAFLLVSAVSVFLGAIAVLLDQGYIHMWDHRDRTNAVANSNTQTDWTRIINWSAAAFIVVDFIFAARQSLALWNWWLAAELNDLPDIENAAFETKEVRPLVAPMIARIFAFIQPALGVAVFVAYFATRYGSNGSWACSFESGTVVMITAALFYGCLAANLMCYSRRLIGVRWLVHVLALLGAAYGIYADTQSACQGSNTGTAVLRSFALWMLVALVINAVALAYLDSAVRQGYERDYWRQLTFDGLITITHVGGVEALQDEDEDEGVDSTDSKNAKALRQTRQAKEKSKGKGKGSAVEMEPLLTSRDEIVAATSGTARASAFTSNAAGGALTAVLLRQAPRAS